MKIILKTLQYEYNYTVENIQIWIKEFRLNSPLWKKLSFTRIQTSSQFYQKYFDKMEVWLDAIWKKIGTNVQTKFFMYSS
jgi:hypothetical protein